MNNALFKNKFAVITAYYKEDRSVIDKAIKSVQYQLPSGLDVIHYLVADGFPQEFESTEKLVHIPLPKSHNDYGDTPRIVGATLAVRDGCYGLMFLDADNYMYPEHIQAAVGAHLEHNQNLIIAKRDMVSEDGTVIKHNRSEEDAFKHVDTGCFVFFKEEIFRALEWAKIPSPLSVLGDRYFWNLHQKSYPGTFGYVNTPTLAYTCLWKDVYEFAGITPPANAKSLDTSAKDNFIKSLSNEELLELKARLHV